MSLPRTLVAGIGNIFLGDDAFGVEVAQRLAGRPLPEGVRVEDFGIRGFDLAYALLDSCDRAILVDATQRGGAPGSLYVIEPDAEQGTAGPAIETHGMDPVKVLRLARILGGPLPPVRVVGCEPATFGSEEEPLVELSEPVRAAVDEAIRLIETLVAQDWEKETNTIAPPARSANTC
jgi:hydrogenase maturation protease